MTINGIIVLNAVFCIFNAGIYFTPGGSVVQLVCLGIHSYLLWQALDRKREQERQARAKHREVEL